MLLVGGADPNVKDNQGKDALRWARDNKRTEEARLLIERKTKQIVISQ